MSILFQIQDKVVIPNPETLHIPPFKDIWERDTSVGKQTALKEFAFMEFSTSELKSNPYKGYSESVRFIKLVEDIIRVERWSPDSLVQEGMRKIIEFQTNASTNYTYYQSLKLAAESIKKFFTNVDLNERNEKTGNPIYKPKDITAAMNDAEKNLSNLASIKKKVEEEIYDAVRNKADKQISPFADPGSLDY